MTTMNMIEAINLALRESMYADDRVVVLGEDVGRLGGVFRATAGLQAQFGRHRVVDTPLAEGAIIGTAVGLAAGGMIPVPEIQFLGFAHQAFHQIAAQVARFRHRSQGRYPMPMTIRAPFGGGVRTPELHSDALEAQFAHCPGLKVVAPSNPADARSLLIAAIADPDPVLFLEPLKGYRLVKGDVSESAGGDTLGSARTARAGDDVTIIAWSASVQLAEQAAVRAGEELGVSVEVLDLRSLIPLDVASIATAAAKTGRVVVVQESPVTGGFASEVIATIVEEAFYDLEAPVRRVGAPDAPYPLPGVEEIYLPSVDAVLEAIREVTSE
ncbi:alpha-ketoacid dehydrogenase subunit beta [Nonomuraea sp. NPDC048916]|uniref:alpha-ketoacid dehydrogenase subunit beta n=1 Tax=Nonomuraea sp. NPDC048916 TaxID=3154232 RepID=UPI0033ED260C